MRPHAFATTAGFPKRLNPNPPIPAASRRRGRSPEPIDRSQVVHHEDARSIDSDSAHDAEPVTGHRWIRAQVIGAARPPGAGAGGGTGGARGKGAGRAPPTPPSRIFTGHANARPLRGAIENMQAYARTFSRPGMMLIGLVLVLLAVVPAAKADLYN